MIVGLNLTTANPADYLMICWSQGLAELHAKAKARLNVINETTEENSCILGNIALRGNTIISIF